MCLTCVIIHALRAKLAEEAIIVLRDALPDHGDAQPVRGQRRVGRRRRGLLDVIDRGRAKRIDLMRGPQMRRELFRKDGRRVHPIDLLQFARQLKLREGGHGRPERARRQASEIRKLPVEVRPLGWKFPVVDDQLAQQQRNETPAADAAGARSAGWRVRAPRGGYPAKLSAR